MKVDNNLVALACVIGAACVASSGHDGWGWLLFIAVVAL